MKRKHYGKYIVRWTVTLLLLVLIVAGAVWIPRLLHIFLTSTGRQPPDVPDTQDYPVQGADVSYYQGNIDWDVLESQGISFCFIKATEGIDHPVPAELVDGAGLRHLCGCLPLLPLRELRQGAGGELYAASPRDGEHSSAGH